MEQLTQFNANQIKYAAELMQIPGARAIEIMQSFDTENFLLTNLADVPGYTERERVFIAFCLGQESILQHVQDTYMIIRKKIVSARPAYNCDHCISKKVCDFPHCSLTDEVRKNFH